MVPPTLRNSDLNHCIFLLYKSARFVSRFHYHTSFKYPHICNPWGKFLPVGTICTTTDMISIPMGAMYLHARTFVHSLIALLYLWVQCIYIQEHFVSVPWVWFIYMQECPVHLLLQLLYPWVRCICMQERPVHSLLQLLYTWVGCIYMQEHFVHSLIQSYTISMLYLTCKGNFYMQAQPAYSNFHLLSKFLL